MKEKAHDEMISLASQLRTHPDISGLDYIESKINDVARASGHKVPSALKYFLEGMRHIRSDQSELALESYALAIKGCGERDFVLSAMAHLLTATIYYELEQTNLAANHFEQALADEHRLDSGTLSWVLVNISGFYCSLAQYEQALETATRGAELSAVSFNDYNHCICQLNIGFALTYMGRAQQALDSLNIALEIGNKNNNERLLAIGHSYMGRALTAAKPAQFEKTHFHFMKAREYFKQALSSSDEIGNELALAVFYNQHNKFSESLEVCKGLIERFSSQLTQNEMRRALEFQSVAYEHLSQWKELAKNESQLRTIVSQELCELESERNSKIVDNVDDASLKQEQLINSQVIDNLGAINAIGQMIATSDNLNDTLPSIFEQVKTVFPTYEFGIALYDENSHRLDYCHYYDETGHVDAMRVDTRTAGNVGSFVVNNLKTVHLNTVTLDTLSEFISQDIVNMQNTVYKKGKRCHSILVTPILLKDQILGILSVQATEANQYHTYHRRLFEQLANFIAISLNNLQQKASLVIANRQLEKLSRTDPLTGLQNRHQLSDLFHQSVDNAVAQNTSFTLALIDIDHYKLFNDTFGHQIGDKALRVVANLLNNSFSEQDSHLFRYGGDEFLLLVNGLDKDTLNARLSALLNDCRQLSIDGVNAPLTLSIGAAHQSRPKRSTNFSQLFDVADEALYRVKNRGRDGIEVNSLNRGKMAPA